jgi:hypothetical protein
MLVHAARYLGSEASYLELNTQSFSPVLLLVSQVQGRLGRVLDNPGGEGNELGPFLQATGYRQPVADSADLLSLRSAPNLASEAPLIY